MRMQATSTHVGDTASVGPESGTGTAKETDIRRDMVLDDVDCASSNFPDFLFSCGTSRPHF